MKATRERCRATSRSATPAVRRSTRPRMPRLGEMHFRELCRREAEGLHLHYGLLLGRTVIGITHQDGFAMLCVAQTDPAGHGKEWDGFLVEIGVGHQGVARLREFLTTVMEMPEKLAWAVAHLLRPYVLCLAPTRRDLRTLLTHDDARVRSETQLHIGTEGE